MRLFIFEELSGLADCEEASFVVVAPTLPRARELLPDGCYRPPTDGRPEETTDAIVPDAEYALVGPDLGYMESCRIFPGGVIYHLDPDEVCG